MKSLLLLAFFSFSLVIPMKAQTEKQFDSIAVRFEGPGHRNLSLIDFDCEFAWMDRDFGDGRDFGGATTPGIFVYSKSRDRWLHILNVSTAGATFGKSPPQALIQAPWDFTHFASTNFVPLPIPSPGQMHGPDKVVFDEKRDAYLLLCDDQWKLDSKVIESAGTTLVIPKKDLLAAFDYRPAWLTDKLKTSSRPKATDESSAPASK